MKKHLSLVLLLAAAVGLGVEVPAQARGWSTARDLDIEIVGDRGHELQQFPVAGNARRNSSRAYVMARRGDNYAIRVHNPTDHRLGLVIAVDGRNIISGKKSHLEAGERMYVLGPHESAEYDGWRTGKDRVNRFYFTDAGDSYAEAFGDDSAMGVIAVAAFRERPHRVQQVTPGYGPGAAPRMGAKRAEPGTGYGESEWSPSRRVHFEPESRPVARYFFKYEWRRTLCEKGIIDCRPERPDNRFWPDDDRGFAPPPPGRRHEWHGYPRY